MFFAVANTFANTFYMQTNGFGKLHWYLNHSHSCGLNRVIRVYHYPVLQVMAERLFQRSLPDHCMNRYLPMEKSRRTISDGSLQAQTYLSALFSCQRTIRLLSACINLFC